MGLVRKLDADSVALGEGGRVDMSIIIRQAVAAEIERQRLESLRDEAQREAELPGDGH